MKPGREGSASDEAGADSGTRDATGRAGVRAEGAVGAAVFASGSGTNFQALLNREERGAAWRVKLLVSDREGAGALERAERSGIPTRVVPVKGRDPEKVEIETLEALDDAGVRVIFLAGYLRLVPSGVCDMYRRRILNIHPALLPSFGGKGMYGRHVHEAVLASGARVSGPTVHLVDERYDEGTILAQWPVPVRAGDRPETLAERVLEVEHMLYPLVAQHACWAVAEGRDPEPLDLPGTIFALPSGEGGTTLSALAARAFREHA